MNIRDIQLLYKIKNALGVGKIKHIVRYNVRNKQHLREIIIPIIDKYPMLTNKQYDFLRFKEALLNDIIIFNDLPKYTRPKEPLNSIENILNKHYFPA